MRICLFTSTALPRMGGQELVVDHLARQYVALGHEPLILAPYPRKPLPMNDADFPYRIVRVWRWRMRRYFLSWHAVALTRLYRRWPFDILHCHDVYPPAYLASLVRQHIPAPVVITSHGGDVFEQSSLERKGWAAERMTQAIQSADALVSISRFTTEGFLRLCATPKRLTPIPNGIEIEAFATPAPRPLDLDPAIVPKKYVVFLGRLNRRKGVDLLLQAWQRSGIAREASLVVIGDGAELPNLQALARDLNIASRVHFVGKRTGAEKVYLLQNAQFGVIPSRGWEAFPLVVLEMQAAGLPIVATDLPGLKDLIEVGRTGILVPAEDPGRLAEEVARLWRSHDLANAMGSAALALAPNFAWSSVARRHLDLYEELLRSRKAPDQEAA